MSTLQARRTNFFRGTKLAKQPLTLEASLRLASDTPGSGTIAEREKSDLVERHLTAFEATLPPHALSSGDRDKIRSRAMLGSSSPAAILASVMQAVAEIKPALSQKAVNYHSSAAGPDARSPDGLPGAGYRGGDPALLRAMYGRDARDRGGDGGIGGLTRVSSSGFGLGSDGNISGMSTQFYQQNFQSLYGASPQGQFTASRVAGILGRNEGLSGEALVARTKEVARDTKERLGLDTNIYAPKVANVGKKYSDPIIENKKSLDEARAAQQRGDAAAQERHERAWLDRRKAIEDQARREDPSKVGDVAGINNGLLVEAVRNGYTFTQKNAAEFWNSITKSGDPQAAQRLKEVVDAASKSEAGRAMIKRDQPLIDEATRAAAQRRVEQTTAEATVQQADVKVQKAAAADVANLGGLDDPPAKPADTRPADGSPPEPTEPAKKVDPPASAAPTAATTGSAPAKATPAKPPAPQ